MGRAVKVIIIEILIIIAFLLAGIALDVLIVAPAAGDPDVTGHPAPAFSLILPIGAAVISLITDIIMIIAAAVKAVIRGRKK